MIILTRIVKTQIRINDNNFLKRFQFNTIRSGTKTNLSLSARNRITLAISLSAVTSAGKCEFKNKLMIIASNDPIPYFPTNEETSSQSIGPVIQSLDSNARNDKKLTFTSSKVDSHISNQASVAVSFILLYLRRKLRQSLVLLVEIYNLGFVF